MSLLNYLAGYLKNIISPSISVFALVDYDSTLSKKAKVNRFAKIRKSQIEKYTYIGPHTNISNCVIGKFCSISWGCDIGLESHTIGNISTSPIFTLSKNGTGHSWVDSDVLMHKESQKTYIGNDVWIGAHAIVMSGVKIGDGAVIGAGAIVTKDVEPYSIVVGSPAKMIKKRFSDEIISVLKKKKWWDLDESLLKENIDLFHKENVTVDDVLKLP